MSYFVYRRLTPDLKRIRLIHLLPKNASSQASSNHSLPGAGPSEPHVPLSCGISHVSLNQPPPYSALSYTWGDTSQKGCILVHGVPFHITKSLEVALTHLMPDDEPLTLWIDALCIDQEDEVEKTEQVMQMQQIYSQATSVITWLGPAEENSDAAMLWMQRYGSLSHSFGIGTKPELRLRCLLQTFESDPKKLPYQGLEEFLRDISTQLSPEPRDIDSSITVALSRLFKRPYWSRVWVVQELVHGKSVQFMCGNKTVSEESLHYSLRLIRNFRQYEIIKSAQTPKSSESKLALVDINVSKPINILKVRRAVGPFPLIYLLRGFRHFQATDPRDKIFALLSFARDGAPLGLYPDYQKSCQEVYLKTTVSLISNGIWDILSLCEVHHIISELPSWVPDFTSQSQRAPLQQRAMNRQVVPVTTVLQPKFNASGSAQTTSVSYDFAQMPPAPVLLRAKFVAKVERVGTIWEHQAFRRWLQELREFSHSDSTTGRPDQLKAAWRTAVADQSIRQGFEKPRMSGQEVEKVNNALKDLDLHGADEQKFVSLGLEHYIYQLQDVAYGRRPFCTSQGQIGIGPCEMEPGDLLYIFIGATVPYILRLDASNRLRLIGEAYAHGVMDGEAMEDGQPADTISLF